MKRVFRRCTFLAVTLLAACAEIAPQPDQFPVPPFELSGRILVNDEEHRFSGQVRWERANGTDDIWLGAPLGQTVAHLHADRGGATLTAADQRSYSAGSIEALTQRALGWRFPAAALRHWVLGEPSPGLPVSEVERDGSQRFVAFTQPPWRVTLAYREDAASQPSRVDVAGNGATMRLVIDAISLNKP
jgi:outer membrane lipoprotein LolB